MRVELILKHLQKEKNLSDYFCNRNFETYAIEQRALQCDGGQLHSPGSSGASDAPADVDISTFGRRLQYRDRFFQHFDFVGKNFCEAAPVRLRWLIVYFTF